MASVPALEVEELPEGSVREVILQGQPYAVCNVAGSYYAVSGECPHQNGPLGHGSLEGHRLMCPWHLWEFDVRTGMPDSDMGCAIATFPVSVSGGMIRIEIG